MLLKIYTLSGTVLILGLGFGIAASAAQAQGPQVTSRQPQVFETVSHDAAKERSIGGVILHFGHGFSEIAVTGLTEILRERGYRVSALAGGPENKLKLCIDGRCSVKHFDINTIGVLTTVVDQQGSYLISKNSKNSQ